MEFAYGPPAWIEWEGVRFYRRSKSGHYADRTGCLLHVAVWERAHKRRIPDGHAVHHKDEDKVNNGAGNLELLTKAEHTRHHNLTEPRGIAVLATAERSGISRNSWANRPERDFACNVCGTSFKSKGQRAMYCSPNCRAAAFRADHRKRGQDALADRQCEWCGDSFTPPDRRTVYCGPACRQRAGDGAKRARNRARLGIPACAACGNLFTPKDGRQRFCSGLCRQRHARREARARWAG